MDSHWHALLLVCGIIVSELNVQKTGSIMSWGTYTCVIVLILFSLLGGGIMGLGALFCRRSVSQVILHKGGGMVTVSTQSPLGPNKGQRITVPLSQVACYAHRQESPTFIPLRVKDHKFYFLLDREGTLNNPKLFDVTVGAYRFF